MTTYESPITILNRPIKECFDTLSDLRNIEKFKNRLPVDKINDMEFDADTCRFSVAPVGRIGLCIVQRDEPKTIKFATEQSPLAFNFWIQFKNISDTETKMKLTLKAEIPMLIKPMVDGKIKEVMKLLSETLTVEMNK